MTLGNPLNCAKRDRTASKKKKRGPVQGVGPRQKKRSEETREEWVSKCAATIPRATGSRGGRPTAARGRIGLKGRGVWGLILAYLDVAISYGRRQIRNRLCRKLRRRSAPGDSGGLVGLGDFGAKTEGEAKEEMPS